MKNFQDYLKENADPRNDWVDRKLKVVNECYRSCPFYGNSMDGMECNHPYWKDKGAYDNMIITHDNSHGRVPDECPLREGSYINISKIRLRKIKTIISDADPYGEEQWEDDE